uniref:Cytochrome b5 reductase like n=1 Tax=Lepisosteus oculatus TaxID=7918 RepID=W5M638_LEPOC
MHREDEEEEESAWARLRPREPLVSECCGSGCRPCVFDTYRQQLDSWTRARARGDISLLRGDGRPAVRNEAILSTESFSAFQLESVEVLTEDTCLYRFKLPVSASLGLGLGQHLVLRSDVEGLQVQRAYTPVSPVHAEGYCEFLIKLRHDGMMSPYIKTWKEGDLVEWRGPFGGFPYAPNKFGQLLMIASGTGIAPMIPLLQHITDNEEEETFVTLVCCFRTYKDIYMKTFLQEQSRFWNVNTFFVLSKQESLDSLPWSYREKTHLGRLNLDTLKTVVESCHVLEGKGSPRHLGTLAFDSST